MAGKKEKIYIISAVRTPIGSLNGSLSSIKSFELGSCVIKEAIARASLTPQDISEVIMGQALMSGQGQNPARRASVSGGLPYSVPAAIVNMVCGSGLRSVVMGCHSVLCGDSNIVVCGGQESMSNAPHACLIRPQIKMGAVTFVDTMLHDGLTDDFHEYLMGVTAENIAKKWNISRLEQDKYALMSQNKTEVSQKSGQFVEEILPITIPGSTKIITEDEFPRHGTTLEKLECLKPSFIKDGTGTVTAGNSSGVNDGAAALVLASETEVNKRQLKPMASIVSWGYAGVDPAYMGTGPIPAVRVALKKANWTVEDVDLWEVNEAFASQSIIVIKELNLDIEKVNVKGGSIALGHPIGVSGSRILVTLLYSLHQFKKKKGVACLCIGGGMGIAMCVEAL